MTLKELLIKHEGYKKKPYKDTVGKLTIGVGRNLSDNGLTDDEIDYILNNDIKRCERELISIFSNYLTFPDNVKMVLVDMIFNLGMTRFLGFKNFIRAIEEMNLPLAQKEMLDSKWARQLPVRAHEDSKILVGG